MGRDDAAARRCSPASRFAKRATSITICACVPVPIADEPHARSTWALTPFGRGCRFGILSLRPPGASGACDDDSSG